MDLNNFAMYPTISVGYLASILRNACIEVEVLSPLASGVPGVARERPPRSWGIAEEALRYWSATTPISALRRLRRAISERRTRRRRELSELLVSEVQRRIATGSIDLVMISTYLQYFDEAAALAALCGRNAIPVVLGGSYLNQPSIGREWLALPGVSAVVAGEIEPYLAKAVAAVVRRADLSGYPGVWTRDSKALLPASPLEDLDAVPFPDYSDFPWHLYPHRIVPILAGRGCGWGVCTFCSDIASATGRGFRSRSPQNVLDEIDQQSKALHVKRFVFTDLKLNSNLPVWRSLLASVQQRVPGASWIGAVHVGSLGDDGLSKDELHAARAAGMVRLTTGLESGSQRMLDRMAKGTAVERNSEFLRNAADADISVRVTLILGYPGETAEDVRQTARFLRAHIGSIERATLNRFSIVTGTTFHRRLSPDRAADLELVDLVEDHRSGVVHHAYRQAAKREYRMAVLDLIQTVHAINCQPLRESASAFEGVM